MSSTVSIAADSTFRVAIGQGETYSAYSYSKRMMEEPFERLQKARRAAGYDEATDAARAFGWNENTYRSHENGQRGLRKDVAERYGRAFRVSAAWLLTGEGKAERSNIARVVGRIGAGAEILVDGEDWPVDGLYEIELPFPISDDVIAFEVEGESMWPRYDPGDIIICYAAPARIEEVIGFEAAVKTEDGRRFLKRVLYGSSKAIFDLESHNAPPIRGVHLVWMSPIHSVIRAGQWRKATEQARRKMLRRMSA